MLSLTGSADITLSVNGVTRSFSFDHVLGYYAWTRLNNRAMDDSVYINYGFDLKAGSYILDLTARTRVYRDPNGQTITDTDLPPQTLTYRNTTGNDSYLPTAGTVTVDVVRLPFRTAYTHTAVLQNVTFADQTPVVILNGKFTAEYK